jgi:hypothetical protein
MTFAAISSASRSSPPAALRRKRVNNTTFWRSLRSTMYEPFARSGSCGASATTPASSG